MTNLANPVRPFTYPDAVDLGRSDGVTDYVHDTDVDDAGIAWTSGNGGVRGYRTSGVHVDPVAEKVRRATAYVPKGSEAATPASHDGFVYAAQYSGGIDVLLFAPPQS